MKKLCLICASILLTFNPNCFSTELKEIKILAEGGDSEAQYELGIRCYSTDIDSALEWLRKAAFRGHVKAKYTIGRHYYNTRGYIRAFIWFHAAADEGHLESQYITGKYYYSEEDYEQAFIYFQRAAEHGHAGAQYELYLMYYFGRGVPKDHTLDIIWLLKSAKGGFAAAQCELGRQYCYEGATQDYYKAMSWFQAAADQGYPRAQHELSIICKKMTSENRECHNTDL